MKNAHSAFTIWGSGFVLLILTHCVLLGKAQQLPAIVRDWAAYAGQTDSVFKTPVVLDEDSNLYVGTFRVDSVTGADVLIVKYGTDGGVKWEVSWTGTGLGRDQVSDLAYYNDAIYVSGITQGSASNNYDMLFMRIASDGNIEWVSTWNGPESSFDLGTAVLADNGGVFVTGASSDSAAALGFRTFSLEPSSGTILWERNYDYANLNDIPFDLGREGTTLVVAGGSQSTQSNWDYVTVFYNDSGTQLSVNRVTGTSSGFDRAQAVKMDILGNVYITGGSYENAVGQEVKTVKIDPAGNLIWVKTYGGPSDDTGNDLVVDANGNVYVCGQTYDVTNGFDLVLIKYSPGGTQLWKQVVDVEKKDDAAVSLCLDSWGHVVLTGYATRDNQFDMLTIGYNENGDELWREYFDGNSQGLDKAASIAADLFGSVFVTGQATLNNVLQTVTLKYRSDFYTQLPQADSPAVAGLYYPNFGQITDTSGQPNELVDYYTVHHNPKLYFGKGKMHMVWGAFDTTGIAPDTLNRVDVTFLGSGNPTKAMPLKEEKEAGYLNYFLGQCPNGITGVYGLGNLLFKKVWTGIDVILSSNNAGMKILFVCEPGSDPSNIGLKFAGQSDLTLSGGWDLEVSSTLGSFSFERPHAYQIDSAGTIISLPWQISWNMPSSDVGALGNWGSYNTNEVLIIEISRSAYPQNNQIGSLFWSSYFGDFAGEAAGVICSGIGDDFYTSAHVNGSANSIITSGVYQLIFFGGTDLVITSWSGQPMTGPYGNREFTTYYGGAGIEIARGIDVNQLNGNVYVTGTTDSPGNGTWPLPTRNSGSNFYYGNLQSTNLCVQDYDSFIAKFSADGQDLLFASYIGGASCDGGLNIDVDNISEKIYLTGYTYSDQVNTPTFPLVPSAFSGAYNQSTFAGSVNKADGYIMEFDKNDNCTWSTYFGGDGEDQMSGVKMLDSGNLLVIGSTTSSNVNNPGTIGVPCPSNILGNFPDCNPGGGGYFDNSFNSIGASNYDCMIAEFNSQQNLIWSTYFGGAGNDWASAWQPLATSGNTSGKFAICGGTTSSQVVSPAFPIYTNGTNYTQAYGGNGDGFVACFKNRVPEFSSYIGGDLSDLASGLTFDEYDFLYLTGNTSSTTPSNSCGNPNVGEFPYCSSPTSFNLLPQGLTDSYVFELDPLNNLTWSTFFGGGDNDQGMSCTIVGRKLLLYGDSRSTSPTTIPQRMISGYYDQGGSLLGSMDTYVSMFKLDPFVGIDELATSENRLLAYPIPFIDLLVVTFKTPNTIGRRNSFSVCNALGQLIWQSWSDMETIHINTSSWVGGVYVLTAMDNNSRSVKIKIVK